MTHVFRMKTMALVLLLAMVALLAAACAGDQGATGPAGSTGSAGPTGAAGAQGYDGPAGSQGAQGRPGQRGAPGPSLNASIVLDRFTYTVAELKTEGRVSFCCFNIYGAGFRANEGVIFDLYLPNGDSSIFAPAEADANGQLFLAAAPLSDLTQEGQYSIVATGEKGSTASTSFVLVADK